MARIHGRNGRVYAAITSAGTAEPIAYLNAWSIDFSTDNAEVTAYGDTNKIYVAGLPDSAGDFGGWYDDATPQMYTAALDGLPRKMYIYPNLATTTQYWFGTALFSFSVSSGVGDAVSVSGSWNAASNIIKVG
jgi:hypothetical protein